MNLSKASFVDLYSTPETLSRCVEGECVNEQDTSVNVRQGISISALVPSDEATVCSVQYEGTAKLGVQCPRAKPPFCNT